MGLRSVANVGLTAYNIDNLGIKAFLKTTGKETAKAMVKRKEGQSEETEAKDAVTQEHPAETEGEGKTEEKQEMKK